MTPSLSLVHYNSDATREISGALADLFVEVFDTPERRGDPFFGRAKFIERLDTYTSRPGYDLVAAQEGAALIGYMSGFSLAPDTKWWSGLHPPFEGVDAVETGHRTFAINELAVREPHRKQGIGTALINELLGSRHEQRATFCTESHNTLLQDLAARYDWRRIGTQQPYPDAPELLVYVRDLPLLTGAVGTRRQTHRASSPDSGPM